MGSSVSTQAEPAELGVNKSHFSFVCPIGKGGFGKVWRVEHQLTKTIFAMKEMSKLRVISKKSVHSVMNERRLLSVVKHPFVVNMQYALQDRENLYLVMDLMTGGDLRYHLIQHRSFTEPQTKFFIACIVMGLEYLHVNKIIHRDIKPENLVFDHKGYLRITDFGIARQLGTDNAKESSGTPGYMAPEVMARQPHGVAVDYFALGVIAYECMQGRRPYTGRNKREIRDTILSKQAVLKKSDVPEDWSLEAADFINKVLNRKANDRLGVNGPGEVKKHSWLRDFPWKRLFEKALPAPFRPGRGDNFDMRLYSDWAEELDSTVNLNGVQDLFVGYLFDSSMRQSRSIEDTQVVKKKYN